jgi:hypothetical protein
MSTKATLSYKKLFDIVDGTLTDNGAIIRPIPAELNDQVEKWQHDHERARDAIIRCLPDAELLKLDDVQDSVTAIWKRLSNEYGRASNLEYVRASNDLTNLKMSDEKTTINDHINKFEQLVHDVNYNKPSDTKNMEESVVNLMFLNTFMVDKISSDKWETFINAKGPQLETMSTQQLYAEVRVNAGRIKPVEPVPNEVKLSKRSRPRFNNLSNPSPLDLTISNETMTTAKDDEEVTEATLATMVETTAVATIPILVAKAKTTEVGSDIPMTRISPASYTEGDTVQKIVIHSNGKLENSSHLATISNEIITATTSPISTIASLSTIERLSPVCQDSTTLRLLVQLTSPDPSDSAANAFITQLKANLHNYRHFSEEVQVKQFDGKPEMDVGSESITLTDNRGNRQTLNDVVYVPECSEQILSLMQFR